MKHTSQFDNIIDWFDWQLNYFSNFIKKELEAKNDSCLFSDQNMTMYEEFDKGFKKTGNCEMKFYIDRIEFIFDQGEIKTMPISMIQTLSPQLRERIEILFENNVLSPGAYSSSSVLTILCSMLSPW